MNSDARLDAGRISAVGAQAASGRKQADDHRVGPQPHASACETRGRPGFRFVRAEPRQRTGLSVSSGTNAPDPPDNRQSGIGIRQSVELPPDSGTRNLLLVAKTPSKSPRKSPRESSCESRRKSACKSRCKSAGESDWQSPQGSARKSPSEKARLSWCKPTAEPPGEPIRQPPREPRRKSPREPFRERFPLRFAGRRFQPDSCGPFR